MPTKRSGFIDSYHSSRLNHLTGTAYPVALTGTFLGLYAGALPASDGTGGTEVSPATRPAITFGATQTDGNGRQYITHAAAVSNITLTNTSAAEIIGFGIFGANSGGTPVYIGTLYPFQAAAGATVTIPAGAVKIYAEPPTI